MNPIVLATVLLLVGGVVCADDAEEASIKVQEYFDAFNARDVDKITSEVYAMPVHIGSGAEHRVLIDEQAATDNLRTLYAQLDEQGWARSEIREINGCSVAPGMVFADVTYSRIDKGGNAIPPDLRTNLYILRGHEDGWRIIAFYIHATDKTVGCR